MVTKLIANGKVAEIGAISGGETPKDKSDGLKIDFIGLNISFSATKTELPVSIDLSNAQFMTDIQNLKIGDSYTGFLKQQPMGCTVIATCEITAINFSYGIVTANVISYIDPRMTILPAVNRVSRYENETDISMVPILTRSYDSNDVGASTISWERLGRYAFYVCESDDDKYMQETLEISNQNSIIASRYENNECYILWKHRDNEDEDYRCFLGHYRVIEFDGLYNSVSLSRIGDLISLSGSGGESSKIVSCIHLTNYNESSLIKGMIYYNYSEDNWEIGDLVLTFFSFYYPGGDTIQSTKFGIGKILDFEEGYGGIEAKLELITRPIQIANFDSFVQTNDLARDYIKYKKLVDAGSILKLIFGRYNSNELYTVSGGDDNQIGTVPVDRIAYVLVRNPETEYQVTCGTITKTVTSGENLNDIVTVPLDGYTVCVVDPNMTSDVLASVTVKWGDNSHDVQSLVYDDDSKTFIGHIPKSGVVHIYYNKVLSSDSNESVSMEFDAFITERETTVVVPGYLSPSPYATMVQVNAAIDSAITSAINASY